MTEDRDEANHGLYIIGIMSLVGGIALVVFALYIFPFLLWKLHYKVPSFTIHWQVWLQEQYDWTATRIAWAIFGMVLGAGFLLIALSDWITHHLDTNVTKNLMPSSHAEAETSEDHTLYRPTSRDDRWVVLKIIVLIGSIIFMIGGMLLYFIVL